MLKQLVAFAVFIGVQAISAQNYDFGKVEKEEIEQKAHALEPDADAVVLYKKRRTYFDYNNTDGWVIITKVHQRIKIYSKEGLNWATHSRRLRISGNDEMKISSIKGYTYNLVGGKVEKTKLKKDGIFKEEISKYRKKVSLTFPNVKEGSVIEWQYTVSSPFWIIDDVQMQYSIPLDKIEAKIEVPDRFVFKRLQKGYFPVKLSQTKEPRRIEVQWREKKEFGGAKTRSRSETLEFQENVYNLSAENVPSIRKEVYVNNINNYRTAFVFELAQYRPKNRSFTNYALSWEDVSKSIYNISSFGAELRKTSYFKEDIDALIGGLSSTEEKMVKIFEYVKSIMNWNDYYGVLCDKGVRKAYKEKTGNAAEINLMLTAMLRYAKIDANPILVSTRSNGIPLFPTRQGFNYVISSVKIGESMVLLDAVDKNSIPNVLPTRVLNWNGRLIRKDGSSIEVPLTPNKLSKKSIFFNAELKADGALSGKVRVQYTNNRALNFRNIVENSEEESYLQDLESNYGGIEISDYETSNMAELYKPVMQTFSFTQEAATETIAEKLYFSPMLIFATTENPFKQEKREFPVDYDYPRQSTYRINIQIPEGYKIESLPESSAIQLPEDLGIFRFAIKEGNGKIQLVCSTTIKSAIIVQWHYDSLKEFYKHMVEKETEKVVLSKI